MKIAMIVPGGVDRSGERRVIPALLSLIRRVAANHELHVFVTHQESEPGSWSFAGAEIHDLGMPRSFGRAVRTIVAEDRRSDFQIIHSIWAGYGGLLAVFLSRLLRIPSIVHIAGGELVAIRDISYGGRLRLRGRVAQRIILRLADRLTAASEPICNLVSRFGASALRVPLGVDLQEWKCKPPTPRRHDERIRIVHAGSLNRVKDQTMLMRALHRLAERGHDFHVDVAGQDTLAGQVQALAADLGIDRSITFHGFLTQAELRPIVQAAHMAVITSRHEAGPVFALEAAAAGVPIVGTAVGHIAEWSPDAALSVPCEDDSRLADAMERLACDDDLRTRIAFAAQQHAIRFDADFTAQAFEKLYSELAGA